MRAAPLAAGLLLATAAVDADAQAAAGTRDLLRAKGLSSYLVVDGDDATVRSASAASPAARGRRRWPGSLRDAGCQPTVLSVDG